jgi:hypothetical protein
MISCDGKVTSVKSSAPATEKPGGSLLANSEEEAQTISNDEDLDSEVPATSVSKERSRYPKLTASHSHEPLSQTRFTRAWRGAAIARRSVRIGQNTRHGPTTNVYLMSHISAAAALPSFHNITYRGARAGGHLLTCDIIGYFYLTCSSDLRPISTGDEKTKRCQDAT